MAPCVRRSPEKRRDVLCCSTWLWSRSASFSFTQEFDLMKAVETQSHKLWDAAQYKRCLPSVQCCNYITQRAECGDVERSGGFSNLGFCFVFVFLRLCPSWAEWKCSMEENEEESFFMLKLQRSESRSHVDPVNQGSLPLNLRRFDLGIKPTTANCFARVPYLQLRFSFERCICRELDLFWYM